MMKLKILESKYMKILNAMMLIKLKIANKKQRTTFNDIKDSLNKLYDHILNIKTKNYDDDAYNLEGQYEYSVYYVPMPY